MVRGNEELMTTEQYIGTSPADNQALSVATEKAMTQMIVQYKKTRAYREKSIRANEINKISIGRAH